MKVLNGLYHPNRLLKKRYEHFESIEGRFYNNLLKFRVVSSNGFAVKIDNLPSHQDFRITRFIRDPRDLIISGYFYHKKGAEPWFRFTNPSHKYWEAINGNIPAEMPQGISYAKYLNNISVEDGLIAEIEFRQFHLESLRLWPEDPRIKLFRYEEILGNEEYCFKEIFKFYELTKTETLIGTYLARKYAYRPYRSIKHIRNPNAGQWKQHFTPKVEQYFNERYGDIIERYQYQY